MLPRLAIVDPLLTLTMPPGLTASTGLDALTQLLEAFVSRKANPLTDALCLEGLGRAAVSLPRAWRHGEDKEARDGMSLAGLLGGLALANAGLGAVHGFAAALGGMFDAPHGAVCGRLLAPVMAANIRALKEYGPSGGLERYDRVARLLTGSPGASALDGVAWVRELAGVLGVPPLGAYGVTSGAFAEIVHRTQGAGSTRGNPVPLTDAALEGILHEVCAP